MAMNNFFIALMAFVLLSSCQTVRVEPGAERIRVFEDEPKGCLYTGEVSSVQESVVIGSALQTAEMDLSTRLDLRNKAHTLGGNVIVFLSKDRKDNSKKSEAAANSAAPVVVTPANADKDKKAAVAPPAEEDKAEHKIKTVFLATVFRCPSSIFNQ